VSLATQSTDPDILLSFYKSVRPFGLWKPIAERAELSSEDLSSKSESLHQTILNIVLAMVAITGMYLFPMYLVGHWYTNSMIWFGLTIAAVLVLKYTWYRNLPEQRSEAGSA